MTNILIMDIETDGLLLEATKVFCMVVKDYHTGEVATYTDNMETGITRLQSADVIVAHNGVMFDIPVLNKLYNAKISADKVFDTLLVSRLSLPDRDGGHSLRAWGKRLGFPKGDFDDFSELSQDMINYCIQDVEVTTRIFNTLKDGAREYYKAFKLEHLFAEIITKQIQSGFKLDIPKVTKLYDELREEYDEVYNTIYSLMPPIKVTTHYNKTKEQGLLLDEDEESYTYTTAKTRVIKKKEFNYKEPNPTSRKQIGSYLKAKGWTPKVTTETGLPKIDEKVLGGLPYTEAKLFARLFRLQKVMGMIKNDNGGWLNYVREDGRVHGDVLTNATNTGRASHARPNMAQVDKKDSRMREVWIPKEGWSLVGCDASGLELRILAHYLAPYDKGAYAYEVINGDVHTHNQRIMGLNTRDGAKTMIYALIYGAGNHKLGSVYNNDAEVFTSSDHETIKRGKAVRDNVLTGLAGYEKLIDTIAKAYSTRGNLKGIDGRPLHPRSDYSALNLLIQSAGAIIMKQALVNFYNLSIDKGYEYGLDYNLVANVHDEFQLECVPEIAEELGKLARLSIIKAGEDFNLKVELDGEYKIGSNWNETH